MLTVLIILSYWLNTGRRNRLLDSSTVVTTSSSVEDAGGSGEVASKLKPPTSIATADVRSLRKGSLNMISSGSNNLSPKSAYSPSSAGPPTCALKPSNSLKIYSSGRRSSQSRRKRTRIKAHRLLT